MVSCWVETFLMEVFGVCILFFVVPLAIIYFANIFLLTFLSWQFVVLVWLILLMIYSLLWYFVSKRERAARNPLEGIIESKES